MVNKSEQQSEERSIEHPLIEDDAKKARSSSPEVSVPLKNSSTNMTKSINSSPLKTSEFTKMNTLIKNIQRKQTEDEFNSEDNPHFITNSSKLIGKGVRKPSEHLLVSKGLLQDGASIATVNHSSDIVTAHFNSTRQKSMTSNDSP